MGFKQNLTRKNFISLNILVFKWIFKGSYQIRNVGKSDSEWFSTILSRMNGKSTFLNMKKNYFQYNLSSEARII